MIGRVVVALLIAGPPVEPGTEGGCDNERLDGVSLGLLVDGGSQGLRRAGAVGDHEHAVN